MQRQSVLAAALAGLVSTHPVFGQATAPVSRPIAAPAAADETPVMVLPGGSLESDQTIRYGDGSRYVGKVRNGVPWGRGAVFAAGGARYAGEFANGVPHGVGSLVARQSGRYMGEFQAGQPHGSGVFFYADGGRYVGQFLGGKPGGSGMLWYADGGRYAGDFREGLPHGKGTYVGADGVTCVGPFRSGRFRPDVAGKTEATEAAGAHGGVTAPVGAPARPGPADPGARRPELRLDDILRELRPKG